MKLILVAFLLVFAAQPCAAATVDHAIGTSGVDCSLPRAELLASEKLICADADLQKADTKLTGVYADLGERLNEGGAQAIELDHSFWFLTYEGGIDARCGIAASRILPADLKAYYRARNCLLTELDKRREAVAALPHEKPAAPYLLSPFERMMLRGMAGTELYLRRLLDKRINRSDNLAVGLQRSLAALLTDTETRHFAWLEGNPFDKFVETSNLGAGTLIDSRFFVYRSNIPADESSESAFVADLATGEIAAAMIDPLPAGQPTMVIWEKACAGAPLKTVGRAQFQRLGNDWRAQWGPDAHRPLGEDIIETACK